MKFLVPTILLLVGGIAASADENSFAKAVKASLVFRDSSDPENKFPHVLKVYLRLENIHHSDVTWSADNVTGIVAELLDSAGNPAPQPPGRGTGASIMFGTKLFLLPYGSSLDWLISHGGISMRQDVKDSYILEVGGHGWIIPIADAKSYFLRIRLHGRPWVSPGTRIRLDMNAKESPLLLDLPPTSINVTPNVEQAGVGQPATKPADKVPAEVQLSPPTPKDEPR